MTYTQAQIDKANAVDLEKFLRAQGENAGAQRKGVSLESPRQPDCLRKQMVSAQPEQERLSGGFRDGILRQVLPRSGADADRRAGRSPAGADTARSPAFRLPLRNVSNANILNYLTQERKLSPRW